MITRLPQVLMMLVLLIGRIDAQVSISTTGNPPDPSSMLDISHPSRGLLIPRMPMGQRNAISLPANALLIYQIDNTPGFYYNRGTPLSPDWVPLTTLSDNLHHEDRIPIDSLPYNITTPGSYYVTDNLTGAIGINISSSHVTIDLNGYALRGTTGNSSEGIEVTVATSNITIRNGSVTNWGKEGIKAVSASTSSFSQLQILSNGWDGIATGNNNLISFVVAGSNGFDGIDMGTSASLQYCTASNNLNDGIEADAGATLVQCTARDNAQVGIRATGSSSITACSAIDNNSQGFSCGPGSLVKESIATNNTLSGFYLFTGAIASHNISRSNNGHGFEWLNDCTLESNNASLNALSGFYTTFTGGKLDLNQSSSNTQHGYFIQNAGGCLIIRNTASGNGVSAFNVLPGNSFATAVTAATINTNTNPFANFQL